MCPVCTPLRSYGLPTLGDFLRADGRRIRALEEALDSDILEVLPTLSEEAKPARRRAGRDDPKLEAALRRVGGTVCLTAPEWYGLNYADGPFLIAGLMDDGEVIILDQADWHVIFEMQPGCVNAYEYAPDGTPLGGS